MILKQDKIASGGSQQFVERKNVFEEPRCVFRGAGDKAQRTETGKTPEGGWQVARCGSGGADPDGRFAIGVFTAGAN
jgi:hypothetical protein